jgi:hypothetical protein
MRTVRLITLSFFVGLASCSEDPPPSGAKADAGPSAPAPLTAEAFGRGRAFDPAKASACLETLRGETKNPRYCGRGPDEITCAGVFKLADAKAPGAPCNAAVECASGPDGQGLCVGPSGTATCRQVKRGKEGDGCFGTREGGRTDELVQLAAAGTALCFVNDGLYCDAATSKCKKRGDVGASCSPGVGACVDAAYCRSGASQCTARTAQGAKCSDPDECAPGSRCANDGSGGAACLAVAGEGGACPRGDECDSGASLVCDTNVTKCVADTAVYERTCSGAAALLK